MHYNNLICGIIWSLIVVRAVSDDKEIESSGVVRAVDMEEAYLQSDQCHATQVKLTAIVDNLLVREKSAGRTISEPVSYATNIFWQVRVLYTTRSPSIICWLSKVCVSSRGSAHCIPEIGSLPNLLFISFREAVWWRACDEQSCDLRLLVLELCVRVSPRKTK